MNRHLPARIVVRNINTGVFTRSMRRNFQPPALVIQRAWRNWRKRKDEIDPISLSRVVPPVFVHVSKLGKETYFTANTLATYIFETGDYRNPLTRLPFSTVEIMRLARVTGVEGILNVGERARERNFRIERNSLRSFFDDEVASAIDLFINYIGNSHLLEVGHMVRHMMTMVFPPIIVTVARVQRSDAEYVNDLFGIIQTKIEEIRNLPCYAESSLVTAIMIFQQFVQDIRSQVQTQSFIAGQSANIDIGGIEIRIDLTNI